MAKHKVFTYGSLCTHEYNNTLLSEMGCKFLGNTATKAKNFKLISLGSFPAILDKGREEHGRIVGELWEVHDIAFAQLDLLEGNGQFYQRYQTELINGEVAWIYVLLNSDDEESREDVYDIGSGREKLQVWATAEERIRDLPLQKTEMEVQLNNYKNDLLSRIEKLDEKIDEVLAKLGTRSNNPAKKAKPKPLVPMYRHYHAQYATGEPRQHCKTKIGSMTLAVLPIEDNVYRVGYAICSAQDNFAKHVGRYVATERLEEKACLTLNFGDKQFSWKLLEQSLTGRGRKGACTVDRNFKNVSDFLVAYFKEYFDH